MAGIASFGGRAGFIGKVADDELGHIFAHDIRATGVAFASKPAAGGQPTARIVKVFGKAGEAEFVEQSLQIGSPRLGIGLVVCAVSGTRRIQHHRTS